MKIRPGIFKTSDERSLHEWLRHKVRRRYRAPAAKND